MRLFIVLLFLTLLSPGTRAAEKLRAAIAQPMVVPGDIDGNIERMSQQIAEASARGAELIVFSECAVTGYDLKGVGAKAAVSADGAESNRLAELAKKQRIAIIAGFHEKKGATFHNTAAVFLPSGERIMQRKHVVTEAETKHCPLIAGERKRTVFEIGGFKCAILICADAGIPGIYDELAAQKCDAVILMTAGAGDEKLGFHQTELSQPERLKAYLSTALACIGPDMVNTTLRLKIAQIACNQSGWLPATGYYHPGGSIVVDHTGEVSAVIPPRFVFEHVKADMAIGTITRPAR